MKLRCAGAEGTYDCGSLESSGFWLAGTRIALEACDRQNHPNDSRCPQDLAADYPNPDDSG